MKLYKAIEIAQLKVQYQYSAQQSDEGDAVKLLIEAGKQIRQIRAYAKELYLPLLPGETDV